MPTPQLAFHLSYDGTCERAFQHYQSVLGGEITMMMRYSDSPMAGQIPAHQQGRIIHASLVLDGQQLMGADAVEGHPHTGSHGFSVSVTYPTVVEGERVFTALGEGGVVIMPFAPTFWAKGFGVLTDRFGVSWMVGGGHM